MHTSSSEKKAQFKESTVSQSTQVSELPCKYRRQQQFHSHSQPFAAAHEQINGWEGTCMQAPVRKRHNLKKAVQSKYVSELPCKYRRQQQFHSHSQPFAAAHEQINGWEGICMQALHIDHATIAQFRQGDFVDQTQHVKNAFYFCMLTLVAWVNKTGQRSYLRTSNMLCQKTSLTLWKFDQLINCVGCRKEIA